LTVSDEDVGFEPYRTAAEQAELEIEEQHRREREEANRDDAPQRALQDMMHGTLQPPDELKLMEEALVREPWMDEVENELLTEAQRATLADYDAQAAALRQAQEQRKRDLEAELVVIRGDVDGVVDDFDIKVS